MQTPTQTGVSSRPRNLVRAISRSQRVLSDIDVFESAGRKTDDDGWTTVPSRSRPASAAGLNKTQNQSDDQSEPTKKQRQNAAKRDAQKAAKEDAERERLARLAKHKRELERVRSEQYI